jgi:hypothetical protein
MTEGMDAAETIRSKKGKKKGKKKRATSSQRGSGMGPNVFGNGNKSEAEDNMNVRDLDDDNKSIKSGRSGRSLGKKKKKATAQKATNNS